MTEKEETTQQELFHYAPPVPIMERSKFAELIGIDPGKVSAWIDRGHIPTIKIGKYRLVNIALLTKEALEGEMTG